MWRVVYIFRDEIEGHQRKWTEGFFKTYEEAKAHVDYDYRTGAVNPVIVRYEIVPV